MTAELHEGGLVWSESADGVWRAVGVGGTYAIKQEGSGKFRAWWLPADGAPVSLGVSSTLGGATQDARRFDPSSSENIAAEEGPLKWVTRDYGQRRARGKYRGKSGTWGVQPYEKNGKTYWDLLWFGQNGVRTFVAGFDKLEDAQVEAEALTNDPNYRAPWDYHEGPAAGECGCSRKKSSSTPDEVSIVEKEKTNTTANIVEVVVAEETAPVLYEDGAAKKCGPYRPAKPMAWKRVKDGHYSTMGALGKYEISHHKPNRRQGVNPWHVSLNKEPLPETFDTKEQAKQFAATWDRLVPYVMTRSDHASPSRAEKKEELGSKSKGDPPQGSSGTPCGPAAVLQRNAKVYEACVLKARQIGPLSSDKAIYELLKDSLAKESHEVFLVLPLNIRYELVEGPIELGRGQKDRVAVDPADLIQALALSTGTKSYVLVHNHPSGSAEPSRADKSLTRALRKATDVAFGGSFGVKPSIEFQDHLVIGIGQWYSFADGKVHKA